MSPIRRGAAVLGVLLLVLGGGLFGYFIGDHFATLAVADEQGPLYTDYSKPLCQGLLNRLDTDWWAMYAGSGLLVTGNTALVVALAPERGRTAIRPPSLPGSHHP